MKPPDKLHRLIHSLSKSEKRYFKLQATFHTGSKKYMHLFAAVARQNEYDETAVKNECASKGITNNFAVAKADLYKLILKNLRQFHSGKSVNSKLREYMNNVEVLYTRGLFGLCSKELQQARKLAETYGRFNVLSEIYEWEMRLIPYKVSKVNQEEFISKNWKSKKELLRKELNLTDYVHLSHLGFLHYKELNLTQKKEDLKKFDNIAQHPLFQDEEKAMSFGALLSFYNMRGIYNQVHGNKTKAYQNLIKTADLFESNQPVVKREFEQYLTSLHNAAVACIDSYRSEEAISYIQKIAHFNLSNRKISRSVELHKFKMTTYLELHLYNKLGEFQNSVVLAEAIMSKLQQNLQFLDEFWRMKLTYELAYSYFGVARYAESLEWINKVLHQYKNEWQKGTYHLHILNFLIHAELQNQTLLESIARGVRSNQKGSSGKMGKLVLKLFRLVAKSPHVRIKKKELGRLAEKMNSLRNTTDFFNEFDEVDVYAWMNSKLTGKSFSEMVKQNSLTQ